MAGQGFIPNDPQRVRGRDGPGGPDAPESVEQARDVIHGRKTVEQAIAERPAKKASPDAGRDAPNDGGPIGHTKDER